jgi:WD40 repeat protein
MRRPLPVALLGVALLLVLFPPSLTGCSNVTGGGNAGFNLPPTVVMTSVPDPARGVPPLSVQFDSSGSSDDGVIVDRFWDFGDGGTSHDISPLHVFQARGVYTVLLTLTDDGGAQASNTRTVTLTSRPVAFIAIDPNSAVAESAPATFKFDASASYDPDDPNAALGYRWDFGDGSREVIPVLLHTFASSGTYRVILTVTNTSGIIGTAERIVQVGIAQPTIDLRSPPADEVNIVCSIRSPLWVEAVSVVTPGVPFTTRAGLDGDRDICDAQIAVYSSTADTDPRRLVGHSQPVATAVFSADSGHVLSGSDDGTVNLYDVGSGDLLRTYMGADMQPVKSVAFTSNSATFVVGRSDGTVELRKTGDNTVVRTFTGHAAAVASVAYSPDGTRVLSGDSAGIAILWNATDGTEVHRFVHGDGVTSVAFSPTQAGQLLTGCRDHIARLWNVSGQVLQEFAPVFNLGVQVAGHSDAVTSVAFSPEGTQVLTGGADKLVNLWQISSGAQPRRFSGHTQRVNSVGFSPDGKQIVSGSDDFTARVWNTADATLVRTLQPCVSPVTAVAFAPNAQLILTAVAARNDIQLDTNALDNELINDLNLRLPVPLDLRDPRLMTAGSGRQYALWTEVRTDQTVPVRKYASATIQVLSDFPGSFTGGPVPVIPLLRNASGQAEASVIAAPLSDPNNRQIVDLGPVDIGDRLFISLLSVPGYMESYTQTGFSVLLLDGQQELYAWYEEGLVLFSRDSKLVIGHPSSSFYVVMDALGSAMLPNVRVRIQHGAFADSQARQQIIYLDFSGTSPGSVSVADTPQFIIQPFSVGDLATTGVLKTTIVSRVAALLAPYNFQVLSSDDVPNPPAGPHNTIYFDTTSQLAHAALGRNLEFWGLSNFVDPRNETVSGRAVIAVAEIIAAFHPNDPATAGTAIGNAAIHHIGLMAGLRDTYDPTGAVTDDIMTSDPNQADHSVLKFTTAPLIALPGHVAIGRQNATALLGELFQK